MVSTFTLCPVPISSLIPHNIYCWNHVINWSQSICWGAADEANNIKHHTGSSLPVPSPPSRVFHSARFFFHPFCRQKWHRRRRASDNKTWTKRIKTQSPADCLSCGQAQHLAGQLAGTAVRRYKTKWFLINFQLEEWWYLQWGRMGKGRKHILLLL